MTILVTGATGFVGQELCKRLLAEGMRVHAALRGKHSLASVPAGAVTMSIQNIGPQTDWSEALADVDTVVHLAARVHVMKEMSANPIEYYRYVNVEGTRRLASMAIESGVKRLVYISTIKVNGERTRALPFRETDVPSPTDPYSISKWEAEEVLREISSQSELEVVIIRPPLIYGPGVKGNMFSLMRYVDKGYPLPFGNINNRRSFISLDNLINALLISATHKGCAGNTFLVSDGHDISTTDLVRRISHSMGKKAALINFPYRTCSVVSNLIPSIRPLIERLTGSLVIDNSKFRNHFKWKRPQTVDEGINSMVSYYLKNVS